MASIENYVLGTDTTEAQRLGIQHRLWASQAASIWERAGVGVGSRVLDVGSGPGFAAGDLAELVGPSGRILGIEGSPSYIDIFVDRMANLGHAHAEVRRGDIHDLASIVGNDPVEGAGTFDVAYCRWVLSFSNDVGRVLDQIRACLKPGGRLIIQDYFNWRSMTLAPRRDAFSCGIEAILAYWEDSGGSNDVMGDIPKLLRDHGFGLGHFEANQRIARPIDPLWAWPDSFWPSIVPRVVEADFLTQNQAMAFMKSWHSASADPDVFIALPPVFDAVAVCV